MYLFAWTTLWPVTLEIERLAKFFGLKKSCRTDQAKLKFLKQIRELKKIPYKIYFTSLIHYLPIRVVFGYSAH